MAGDRQFDSAPLTSSPPGAWRPLWQLAQFVAKPMEQFLRIEAASGALLLVAAASALIWANSPASETYVRFWQVPVAVTVGSMTFARTLQWVVNDGLMTVFFFLVGLEIRREIHQGVLSDWQRAALPAAAAAGGMLVPAGLYLLIAGMPTTRTGWGIPMATDIAFALAVMGLLGGRVPPALRVWLLALAVIDDLGSIVVISLFYSSGIATKGLVIAAAGLAALLALKGLGVRTKVAYVLPAVVVWAGIYGAGIHPTIAGVAVGLLTPVRPWLGTEGFRGVLRRELDSMDRDVEVPSPFSDLSGTLRRVGMARR
ncbi:MAG: hypothetical protein RL199_2034, partial [Pseudomonadota bacterium]